MSTPTITPKIVNAIVRILDCRLVVTVDVVVVVVVLLLLLPEITPIMLAMGSVKMKIAFRDR